MPSNLIGGTLSVTAIGAAGENGNQGSIDVSGFTDGEDCWSPLLGTDMTGGGVPGSGGQGADVSGSVAASPGQTLFVEVGGTASLLPGGDYAFTLVSIGGFNGGGSGGSGVTSAADYCGGFGGGGGGASDVQTCAIGSCTGIGTVNDPRLIVAAGGAGGGGSGSATISPGFNGGSAGQNGTGDGTCCVVGGVAGANANGQGGTGGMPDSHAGGIGGGGGGGGGFAAGGGGQSGTLGGAAGGGGGTNRVPPGGSQSLTSTAAYVDISYKETPPTSLAASGTGTYGGTGSITATLTSHGAAVSGKLITIPGFCGGTSLPSCPTTGSNGTATLSVSMALYLPGQWGFTASFAGDSSFASSTASGTLLVGKAGSATTVACTGAPFTYTGNGQGCTASWASTGNDGGAGSLSTITYTGRNSTSYNSTVAPTGVGDYTAAASFAGDTRHNGSSGSANFSIVQASSTITFGTIPSHTYGDAPFVVTPSASSGLAVSVVSNTTGVCTVASSPTPWTVTILHAGSCSLTASQAGNASYLPAPSVTQSFTVKKKTQSIYFPATATQKLASGTVAIGPTATSGLAVMVGSNTASVCSVSGDTVSLLGAGTCSLTANQAGSTDYNAAPPVTRTFDVESKNVVKDGGFETPKEAAGGVNFTVGHKLGPWLVTAGSVGLTTSYWQNAAGVQSVDLAGLTPGTITQTITLQWTATYTIHFKYAGNPDGAPTTKHMTVAANAPSWGSPVTLSTAFNTTGHTDASMGWKAGKLTFSGTAGDVVTISFADTDGGATAYGMTLDAVSVTGG